MVKHKLGNVPNKIRTRLPIYYYETSGFFLFYILLFITYFLTLSLSLLLSLCRYPFYRISFFPTKPVLYAFLFRFCLRLVHVLLYNLSIRRIFVLFIYLYSNHLIFAIDRHSSSFAGASLRVPFSFIFLIIIRPIHKLL